YIGELGANFEVYRNDDVSVDEIRRKKPRGILISPGPGAPKDSGISLQTVLELGPSIPIFGVCMGLQCIGEAFGGNIVRSPYGVVHGKSAFVYYDEKLNNSLFFGLPNPFEAARYHSLVIKMTLFLGMFWKLQHGLKMDLLWLQGTKSLSIFRVCSFTQKVSLLLMVKGLFRIFSC
ncbi:hypothetical protein HPP92_010989, partial [Vanilla planifolia]